MTRRAVRFIGLPNVGVATKAVRPHVIPLRDQLDVPRVDTRGVFAGVVRDLPGGDWPASCFVDRAVGVDRAPDHGATVLLSEAATPFPAIVHAHPHPNFSLQIGPMPRRRHSERSVALQMQQTPVSCP